MLNIPESVKALFRADLTRKNFRVQFPGGELPDITNSNVVRESVHFTESLCSQSVFRFGLAEASVIEFETAGVGNMYGMTISCAYEIDTSSLSAADLAAIQSDPGDGELVLAADSDLGYGYYRVPLGLFRVDKCPRNHGAMTHRQVTAYSLGGLNQQMNLPAGPWTSLSVDVNALIGYAATSSLADEGTVTMAPAFSPGYLQAPLALFDSTGKQYWIEKLVNMGDNSDMIQRGQVTGDFFRASLPTFDPAAYEALGKKIADALTASGRQLIYDSQGHQVFPDNETAIRTVCPFFFTGAGLLTSTDMPSGSGYEVFRTWSALENGKLTPRVSESGGFAAQGIYTSSPENVTSTAFAIIRSTAGQATELWIQGIDSSGSSTGRAVLSLGNLPGLASQETATIQSFSATLSGQQYQIAPGTPSAQWINTQIGSPLQNKLKQEDIYAYDALKWYEAIGGALEVLGQFAKADRGGAFEVVELDPSAPVSVLPEDYEEVWWDEYDVSPIGTVTVAYGDGTTGDMVADVVIGGGASVYDMTDNSMLKSLASPDLSIISGLLAGSFAANAANVGFTPVEMAMQGWPWIEAGDALEITAEDGTVVNTYALRIELSGIQKLTAEIVSEGGEIIGEV